jgi:hypothetical protein
LTTNPDIKGSNLATACHQETMLEKKGINFCFAELQDGRSFDFKLEGGVFKTAPAATVKNARAKQKSI